jgi:hypothetical protein
MYRPSQLPGNRNYLSWLSGFIIENSLAGNLDVRVSASGNRAIDVRTIYGVCPIPST